MWEASVTDIVRNLFGVEDLLVGEGIVVQMRNGVSTTVTKFNLNSLKDGDGLSLADHIATNVGTFSVNTAGDVLHTVKGVSNGIGDLRTAISTAIGTFSLDANDNIIRTVNGVASNVGKVDKENLIEFEQTGSVVYLGKTTTVSNLANVLAIYKLTYSAVGALLTKEKAVDLWSNRLSATYQGVG
jgi:hypothetical protein